MWLLPATVQASPSSIAFANLGVHAPGSRLRRQVLDDRGVDEADVWRDSGGSEALLSEYSSGALEKWAVLARSRVPGYQEDAHYSSPSRTG